MKNQTLIGSNCYLHTQMTTLGYDSLENPAVLQAAVSAIFSAGIEAASKVVRIVGISPPSVQLISRQSKETVVWFISFVVTFEGQMPNVEEEIETTKAVPGELQGIADVAAALGGRVKVSNSPPVFGSMLGGVRIGPGSESAVFKAVNAGWSQSVKLGFDKSDTAELYGPIPRAVFRHNSDERSVLSSLFASGAAAGQSTASNAQVVEEAGAPPTKVIKAKRFEKSEEVHVDNNDRGRLPDPASL